MLAYSKQYSEFCSDINKGQITDEIIKSLNRQFSNEDIVTLIDKQRIAYSNLLKKIREGVNDKNRKRKVIVVRGVPW